MDIQISYDALEKVMNLPKDEQKKMTRYIFDRRHIDKIIEYAYYRGVADAQNSETWDDVSKSQYD